MAKRIVVTGGTGFIGGHLVAHLLERGDDVVVLSRDPERASLVRGANAAFWDPTSDGPWFEAVDGVDAVIHLAGEQAVGVRYTPENKRRILESRVLSTQRLMAAMAKATVKPKTFVCASGVNYYGARPSDQSVDEKSDAGSDFLAEVCVKWEAEARRAEDLGIREVRCRLGIVLGQDGGALERMVLPFKFFVGGRIGSGEQMVSWIHVDDAAAAFAQCIDDESIHGPVNFTSPNAVTNRELSNTIGSVLHRPSWLPVPSSALKAAFADGAEPILTGQRVLPGVLESMGFQFQYSTLRPALERALSAA